MKLTIMCPDGFKAVVENWGQYYITRNNLVTMLSDTEIPSSVAESRSILAIGHRSVSRKHLKMDISDKVILTDLQSKYGSFLDEQQFEQTELAEAGMYRLRLGHLCLKIIYEK